jgi:hypothetical protein
MSWLAWRQFRVHTLAAAAVLAATATYLLVTGTGLRHAYTADVAACHAPDAQYSCFGLMNQLRGDYGGPLQFAELLVMAVPALIGIFWGAPLVAAELERGTHQLAWTQSVTRTRWLTVKLTLTALAATTTAGLLSLLLTWWAGPLDAAAGNRWAATAFNARDVVPLGYTAFAFALGVTAGLLIRRGLPAMAATLAIFVAVQLVVTVGLRPHLLPAATTTVTLDRATMSQAERFSRDTAATGPVTVDLPGPPGAWIFSETPALTATGQPVRSSAVLPCWNRTFGPAIAGGKAGSPDFGALGACLAPLHLHVDIRYQPARRYWPLQWLETTLYATLAALLTAAAFWRLRRLRS